MFYCAAQINRGRIANLPHHLQYFRNSSRRIFIPPGLPISSDVLKSNRVTPNHHESFHAPHLVLVRVTQSVKSTDTLAVVWGRESLKYSPWSYPNVRILQLKNSESLLPKKRNSRPGSVRIRWNATESFRGCIQN